MSTSPAMQRAKKSCTASDARTRRRRKQKLSQTQVDEERVVIRLRVRRLYGDIIELPSPE